ncbi:sigma-70 family RNA polymerase sigma factor [Allopontixanthobacter sp.]|uniref:sigma-70 family RNA polymerase sigma factor n=1 Tax=Allopontixanthobacter sp. TaxID=2906452 RepID=UPI002ABACA01|nr:sigma-70 family RNA polymerase sigma factor [Allopontixanthobacter sp.]MDZ4307017.1 sigma-70 family RNA polymerase sigma factor [Allopontixanthobacter sp.]
MIADDATMARLMAMSQGGDRQAYATLLTECEKWLRRFYARRIVPHQIDDLVQDTLLSLHRKLASYDPERPFLPWLAAIARYRWVDHLRKVYKADETGFDDSFAADSAEPAIVARISLDRMFSYLPPAQARVIELVKIEGLSISEASHACGQSESLVKVNIHRGLKKLAAMIEKE